jgi:hypothetical protein
MIDAIDTRIMLHGNSLRFMPLIARIRPKISKTMTRISANSIIIYSEEAFIAGETIKDMPNAVNNNDANDNEVYLYFLMKCIPGIVTHRFLQTFEWCG